MDAEKNIPVNEEDIVYLTDEEGKEHPCLILDCIDFNDKSIILFRILKMKSIVMRQSSWKRFRKRMTILLLNS